MVPFRVVLPAPCTSSACILHAMLPSIVRRVDHGHVLLLGGWITRINTHPRPLATSPSQLAGPRPAPVRSPTSTVPRRQGQKGRQKSRAGQRRQNSLLARSRGRTPLGAPGPAHHTRDSSPHRSRTALRSITGWLLSKVNKMGSGEGGGENLVCFVLSCSNCRRVCGVRCGVTTDVCLSLCGPHGFSSKITIHGS